MRPFFSVIIATYGRLEQVEACLEAIARQDYPPDRFEVVVVDDGSPLPLSEPVPALPGGQMRLVRQSHRGVSAARNRGAQEARGEYLVFTADDCTPATGWLTHLALALARTPEHAVGGPVRNAIPENLYCEATHRVVDFLSFDHGGRDRPRFLTPNNLAIPAAAFRALDGFDEAFVESTGEDRDFCARWLERGHRLAYAPLAEVWHLHPLGLASFLRKHYSYGWGSYRYRRRLADRRSSPFAIEPARFYVDLVRAPLDEARDPRSWKLAGLLLVSQLANGVGFCAAGMAHGAGLKMRGLPLTPRLRSEG